MAENPPAHIEVRGAGKPVVVLHGWGSSAELMLPVANCLSAGHQCLVADLPGHGDTAEPPDAWATDDFATWVLAVMDRMDVGMADFIGHSHGGRIAISIAAKHPERVGKLVLVASAGIRARQTAAARWRVRRFKAAKKVAAVRGMPMRNRLQKWVDIQGSADYRAASGVMRSTLVKLVNTDLRPLLPEIKAPTLLVWGDRDTETPIGDAHEMDKAIPDSGLVVLDGGGHFAYAEQLPKFCAVVNHFLDTPQ